MFARPRKGAGRLEDHASCHFHGVVGKALVESAQQRHVDGGRHSVLPFAVHQHGEQMPVQVVHRVVFFADLGGLSGSCDNTTSWALLPNSTATLPISAK